MGTIFHKTVKVGGGLLAGQEKFWMTWTGGGGGPLADHSRLDETRGLYVVLG